MHYVNHNLRFYRLHNRFTQQEIADELETTLGRIKMYEQGHATPPIDMLIKISNMLHVSLDTLIKVKLSAKNYLNLKGQTAPDLNLRLETLEQIVNKIVNKKPEKLQKQTILKK